MTEDQLIEAPAGDALSASDLSASDPRTLPARARPHFARAHALLSADAWFVANEPARLARLAKMAGTTRTSSVE
ncbi:MAG: hypothetical protein IT332_10965 [Ardenticatenales bacterium]|nr:hypothetical protein [Ardenticatenales bacterium]